MSLSESGANVVDGAFEGHFTKFEGPTPLTLGSAVRARVWYREFREIVLMFAISTIEQLCEPL